MQRTLQCIEHDIEERERRERDERECEMRVMREKREAKLRMRGPAFEERCVFETKKILFVIWMDIAVIVGGVREEDYGVHRYIIGDTRPRQILGRRTLRKLSHYYRGKEWLFALKTVWNIVPNRDSAVNSSKLAREGKNPERNG